MVNALCLPTPSICLSASALCQLTHPSFSYSPAHFSLFSSFHVLLLNSYMRSLPVSCGFEIYSISRVWPQHSPRVRSAQNNEVRCLVLSEFMSSHGFFLLHAEIFPTCRTQMSKLFCDPTQCNDTAALILNMTVAYVYENVFVCQDKCSLPCHSKWSILWIMNDFKVYFQWESARDFHLKDNDLTDAATRSNMECRGLFSSSSSSEWSDLVSSVLSSSFWKIPTRVHTW